MCVPLPNLILINYILNPIYIKLLLFVYFILLSLPFIYPPGLDCKSKN